MSDKTTPRKPRHAAPADEAAAEAPATDALSPDAPTTDTAATDALVSAADLAAELGGSASDADLPPDAAARDAAKRDELPEADSVIHGEDIRFVTRGVSDTERAAVIAVLTAVRSEETQRVKRVARRDRDPWARSQRVPDRISDLLIDG